MSLDQETRVVSESEQNVANLRQISSLVAQFQQEAQNEKESRVQAQIQAQEKVSTFTEQTLLFCISKRKILYFPMNERCSILFRDADKNKHFFSILCNSLSNCMFITYFYILILRS